MLLILESQDSQTSLKLLFRFTEIEGVKQKDFKDFLLAREPRARVEVAELMKCKAHLTHEGLDQIKVIRARMNKARQ